MAFALRQTAATFFFVPGVWQDVDYVAMAEKIGADLDRPPTVVVAYDTLPEGDPGHPAPAAGGHHGRRRALDLLHLGHHLGSRRASATPT